LELRGDALSNRLASSEDPNIFCSYTSGAGPAHGAHAHSVAGPCMERRCLLRLLRVDNSRPHVGHR
jgi:hypothetical protein